MMAVRELVIIYSEKSPLYYKYGGEEKFENIGVEYKGDFIRITKNGKFLKAVSRSSIVMIEVDRDE